MSEMIKAVYDNGTLVLDEPLSISNGSTVDILVVNGKAGLKSSNDLAKRMAKIAALPLEGKTLKFSGRDHDQVLYRRSDSK